ncbi:McrB family protein [Pontibacter toksunensis]|uniref:McrB family protein n=1 Tax=Pontibacter toksunensis TaxID=1332631 RepID=A0ABW6C3R6_9BACT
MAFEPNKITKEHIRNAVSRIKEEGIDLIPSTRWDVCIDKEKYPPKDIMRYAHQEMNGENLWIHSGGRDTNRFLERLGFDVVEKENISNPIKELIQKYKVDLRQNNLASEVYKWKLLKKFQGRPNLNAPDFYEEIKSIDYSNLIYGVGIGVIHHIAKDRPEPYRDCFITLFNEEFPLANRLQKFSSETLKIYRELQPNPKHSHHHDERTMATLLTYYNPGKYALYKDSFYQKYCQLLGIKSKKVGEKYLHYLNLLDDFISDYLVYDNELLELVNDLLPDDAFEDENHKLLAQDILYRMLDGVVTPSQKEEKAFQDMLKKSSTDDLNVYFHVLDRLIEELDIADEAKLTFSTSELLSFQIGIRYCLNLKGDKFDFIAPEEYTIEGVHKGQFEGKTQPSFFHKASAEVVMQHYPAIKQAVQSELENNKYSNKKKHDNLAFRKAAFDKEYRTSMFDYQEIKPMTTKEIIRPFEKPAFPLNQILYGPPGTGKTYNTIELAVELITGKKDISHSANKRTFDRLKREGQIEFITFHQNYSYEDFVVGIKPDLDHADLKFRKNEGIFYKICERAKQDYEMPQKQTSSSSPKSFEEVFDEYFKPLIDDGKEIEIAMKSGKILTIIEIKGNSIRLRYHSGSEKHSLNKDILKQAYEDRDAFEDRNISDNGNYNNYRYVLEELWELGKQYNIVKHLKNYVLIIDEINRSNISRVFGELITLLEEDKRLGAENELKLTLPNGEQDFALPPNLYILGTMNTADKSIALVDIALRRRFEFTGFYPTKATIDALAAEGKVHDDVPALLAAINKKIFDKKGADYLVGHAYFINELTDTDLVKTIKRKVIPLLMEYFSGKIDVVRELFSNSGYTIAYDTDNYDWAIAKA